MLKQIKALSFFIFLPALCLAQDVRFLTSGIIEYEKKSNIYAIMRKQINKNNEGWLSGQFDEYKRSHPQFKISKSTLRFSNNETLFTPVEQEETNYGSFDTEIINQHSVVYNRFDTGISIIQKTVFEQTYLLSDSTRKINWKITDEIRDIAGYQCRRANAIIMDSIYVVAFFTNNIPVTGGPESFNGLPGMILGVALPHENISWFATKVTDINIPAKDISPPKTGKATDNILLKAILMKALKEWGIHGQSYLKAFLL